jgi:D-psicose/D-tagatose/L-ribulose 3-epimerase
MTVTNPLGVHSLVWTGRFDADGAEHAVRSSKQAGYDLLEVSLHQPELLDVERTRELLAEYDLGIACSRGLDFDSDPSSPDPAVAARGEQVLQETLQLTAALGGRYFGGALYSALGKYGQALTPRGRDNAVAIVGRLATTARDLGVTLGLEICNRYETNVMNTAAQCLAFIDDVQAASGAGNVVVHLDTYHMNIEEQDFVRPVQLCGDRLGYVHVGENDRGYLGSGHIDFRGFFHALADIGYAGPITFESFSSEVVTPGLSDNLAIWRDLWADGADLAGHAHDFVVEQLVAAGR